MDTDTSYLVIGLVMATALIILICRLWINAPSRRIDRYFEQILSGETPDFPVRTDWENAINLDSSGFSIEKLTGSLVCPVSVQWDSVLDATAFKRDLIATDRVCIQFQLSDNSYVEVHEEMRGWIEFCELMPDHLLGAPAMADWFMAITTPAFELNPTCLFRRNNPMPPRQSKLQETDQGAYDDAEEAV